MIYKAYSYEKVCDLNYRGTLHFFNHRNLLISFATLHLDLNEWSSIR